MAIERPSSWHLAIGGLLSYGEKEDKPSALPLQFAPPQSATSKHLHTQKS